MPGFLKVLLAAPFAIAAGLVVFDFRIGPVVLFGTTPGTGVHEGDLFFGLPLALIALALLALPGPKPEVKAPPPARVCPGDDANG